MKRESLISLLIAGALLLLLPLLAVLQYRWLGQVSERDREHSSAILRAAANRFAQEVDQELMRLYVSFLPDRGAFGNGESAEDVTLKYESWQGNATHRRLVKAIYLVQSNEDNQLILNQLDVAAKQFVSCDWPPELVEWRAQRNARSSRQPQSFDGEVPALFRRTFLSAIAFGEARNLQSSPPEFLLLLLDSDFLRKELLPVWVERHFGGELTQSYEIAIISRGKKLIYASNPGNFDRPDVSVNLFQLRADELRRARFAQGGFGGPGAGGPPWGGPPPWAMAGENNGEEPDGGWQLLMRHRNGSLDATIASTRRRNLLVSFGVLLLLAASLILIGVSAKRAQQLARQQMDFVAGVSHELRTPLSVIDSAAYNLTKGIVREPEDIHYYGTLVRQESRRLKEMIEQVLEYAGAESGRQQFSFQPTDLHAVLKSALAGVEPLLTEGGFDVEQQIAAKLPTVNADSLALTRAIQNLLSNAIKYSGESRCLKLRVEVLGNESKPELRITVSDKGLGIAAEDLPHLFEPFYRAAEVRAAQIHGNGLGLSLVKNIIEAHHGRITIESEVSKGSAFTLVLPATQFV